MTLLDWSGKDYIDPWCLLDEVATFKVNGIAYPTNVINFVSWIFGFQFQLVYWFFVDSGRDWALKLNVAVLLSDLIGSGHDSP